jgi:Cu(I)/Ag(I) efflux system membrane protein CusA/SilA
LRELRDNPEALKRILVAAPDGTQIPLEQLASIHFRKGPQNIKSEDTFLVGYVLFDKKEGHSEVEVVEEAKRFLKAQIGAGALEVPDGVSYTFAGSYENQVRSEKKLKIVLPLALLVIFLLLYLHFKSALVTMIVFTGILCAWAGGFWMLWFYGQSWFLDFSILGVSMRELFQVHSMNLSVAVWVGFLALFGIATDDGAIMATYLQSSFQKNPTRTVEEIREAVVEAGKRRVRPCVMTTLTTLMALLPVLTSSGRGSDIMIPMAIPTFGGMTLAALTMFVTPVLFCFLQEKLHGHDTPNDHITDHFVEKQFGS